MGKDSKLVRQNNIDTYISLHNRVDIFLRSVHYISVKQII